MIRLPALLIIVLTSLISATSHAAFSAGTAVVFKGQLTPIETIQQGNYVLGQQVKTGNTWTYPVTETFTGKVKKLVVLTVGEELIETTPQQLLLTKGGKWVNAGKLRVGERLVSDKGRQVAVKQVEWKEGEQTVYTFEVGEAHTFFVGEARVLAHNPLPHAKHIVDAIRSSFPPVHRHRQRHRHSTDTISQIAELIAEFTPTRVIVNRGTIASAYMDYNYLKESDPEIEIMLFIEGDEGMHQNCHGYACGIRAWINPIFMTRMLKNEDLFERQYIFKKGYVLAWRDTNNYDEVIYEHSAIITTKGKARQTYGSSLFISKKTIKKSWHHAGVDVFRPTGVLRTKLKVQFSDLVE